MLQVRRKPSPSPRLPRLHAGDHLDQPTFHARYKQMPDSFRAELVEGVVFVPFPVSPEHGQPHSHAQTWLGVYSAETPGTLAFNNTSVLLGPDSQPQPDSVLIIDPACGGQMTIAPDGYYRGAPELAVEVAYSSEAFDLYEKLRDYERGGVREYLVVIVREREVRWFERRGRKFHLLPKRRKNLIESRVFPGLVLEADALFHATPKRILETLRIGLASPEHAAFVASLRKSGGG